MQQAITITNLNKRFGTKPVLQDVSLNVHQCEIFGFLGPNGAGKTTAIRCVMDFIRPNSGVIKVFDVDAQKDATVTKSLIGYLPADNQLYDKWTAKQHIDFYSAIKGSSSDTQKLVKRLGLKTDLPVKSMSTGNKQKLGFVLALIGQPKLLILDEPTRGMDPLLQNEIYAILKRFVADGGTVFLSSHNLAEVEHICTNVGVIRDGVIVANKSMDDIRAMKVHIVTATFADPQVVKTLKLPGVEIAHSGAGRVVMKMQGDINSLMRELSKHTLKDVEITHAPLEDVFMEYYRS
jgi:ABC-2 type transport system ATP-binding protein